MSWAIGAQVVPPHDTGIVGEVNAVPLGELAAFLEKDFRGVTTLGRDADDAYLAVAAKAMQSGTVPPTVNFTRPAGDCTLNLSGQPRQADIRYAIAGTFTVGGQSAAVVLKRQ